MKQRVSWLILLILFSKCVSIAQKPFDFTLTTTQGDLTIKTLGHASVMLEWNGLEIYVDPYSKAYNFTSMPKADMILITHEHDDHFDTSALNKIKKDSTLMIYTPTCKATGVYTGNDTLLSNHDSIAFRGIGIKAVPAYNSVKTRHAKGVGNGYILTLANRRVYIAGDTEFLPEMDSIKNIDIAFFGYSVFNMDDAMFVKALTTIKPDYVIPYHYDNSSVASLKEAVSSIQGVVMLTEGQGVSVGLKQIGRDNAFPNPANSLLYSNRFKKDVTITLFNNSGQVISSFPIQNEGMIDVGHLATGVYTYALTYSGELVSGRFLIKR